MTLFPRVFLAIALLSVAAFGSGVKSETDVGWAVGERIISPLTAALPSSVAVSNDQRSAKADLRT